MARHAAAAVTLALFALACVAVAQDTYDSTGSVIRGYTVVSNVTGYLRMSLDACEIAQNAMASPPNFQRMLTIYQNGSNVFRPDGRTRRVLSAWASGSHATSHPHYTNGSALYNDTNWMGGMMLSVLSPTSPLTPAQRAVIAVNIASLQLPLSYMMTELYSIAEEIDPAGTNVTATGPPHALDEGFGAWYGVSECSPAGYFEESSAMFGTQSSCNASAINDMIVEGFNAALAAILAGNVAGYEEARDNIIRLVQVGLIQNVLARARTTDHMASAVAMAELAAIAANEAFLEMPNEQTMAAAVAADAALANATEFLQVAQADAYSVFRSLGPFIYMHDPMAATAINHFMSVDATPTPVARGHYAQIHMALTSLLPHMGITPDMIGTYGDVLEGCPPAPAR